MLVVSAFRFVGLRSRVCASVKIARTSASLVSGLPRSSRSCL